MDRPGPSAAQRDLARTLVLYEATSPGLSLRDPAPTSPVIESLRLSLTTLVGNVGFRSLMSRALTLAKCEESALQHVQVNDDGTLDGLSGDAVQANHLLIAHLIDLLTKFIGETLTLRLLHDAWPQMPGFSITSEATDQS